MKKYIKPELFYEKYELNQHIADCAWELINLNDKDSCKAQADAELLPNLATKHLFMDAGYGCDLTPATTYQDYCYHDGAQGVNVFKS